MVLALAVVSAFGVQLVETFHAKTLSKNENHKTLTSSFKGLHDKMSEPLTEQFFCLEKPWFPGVSQQLLDTVLLNYKPHIGNQISTN